MKIPTNKVRDIAQYFRNELSAKYSSEEIEIFIQWCFEDFSGLSRNEILHAPEKNINESDLLKYSFAVKGLKRGRPIQYVLGKADFYGLKFEVDPAVLIPRPETEELVSLVIAESAAHPESFSILDIGTGSGCIAITLKTKISRAHVYAADISEDALQMAKMNATDHKTNIHFLQVDVLDRNTWNQIPSCSIIVSNPPYVAQSEASTIKENVLNHEPHLALFVPDNDALVFYRVIAELGKQKLKSGGKIFVEINEQFGIDTCMLFQQNGYKNVLLKKDLQGKDRFVIASF
jgi:release factor glutamine methyltransferase